MTVETLFQTIMNSNITNSAATILFMAAAVFSFTSCKNYDDFEIAGTVVEQEFCTNLQNRGYVVALSSPEGVGGSYVCDDGSRYDNVVVVRTMSKSSALAGMRIGYAFGSEELIGALKEILPAYTA